MPIRSFTPTSLWEAYASGSYGEGQLSPSTSTDYQDRTEAFYEDIVGPAFGFASDSQEGLQKLASIDTYGMEQAEREFRLSIGDPYGAGTDPFQWETLSRYDSTSAQNLLESALYEKGKKLGGEFGEEFGLGMEKEEEAYTTSLSGEREALTYGELTAGMGLQSGGSGAVLRSGSGMAQPEDILKEAYKDVKDIGAEYREGKAIVQTGLESSLDTALTKYLDTLQAEKENWFSRVMQNVSIAKDITDFGVDEFGHSSAEIREEFWGGGRGGGEKWEAWQDYEEPEDVAGFRTDAACGIGELYIDGECQVIEGLQVDDFGVLCPEGTEIDECGDCGGNGLRCQDECGVPNGDNSSCADCNGIPNGGSVLDECGVCGGNGSSCVDFIDTQEAMQGETDGEGYTGTKECNRQSDCPNGYRCDNGMCLEIHTTTEEEWEVMTSEDLILENWIQHWEPWLSQDFSIPTSTRPPGQYEVETVVDDTVDDDINLLPEGFCSNNMDCGPNEKCEDSFCVRKSQEPKPIDDDTETSGVGSRGWG